MRHIMRLIVGAFALCASFGLFYLLVLAIDPVMSFLTKNKWVVSAIALGFVSYIAGTFLLPNKSRKP